MTREEKYDLVNECETYDELADVIEFFGENGVIKGRTREFSSIKMAQACRNFDYMPASILTREFGIRQQAIYIKYYLNKL
jgi:hypothetical protein